MIYKPNKWLFLCSFSAGFKSQFGSFDSRYLIVHMVHIVEYSVCSAGFCSAASSCVAWIACCFICENTCLRMLFICVSFNCTCSVCACVSAEMRRILQQRAICLHVFAFVSILCVWIFPFHCCYCVSFNEYQKKPNFCGRLMSFLSVLIFFYFARYQLHDSIIGFVCNKWCTDFFFLRGEECAKFPLQIVIQRRRKKKTDSKNGNPIVWWSALRNYSLYTKMYWSSQLWIPQNE